MCDLFASAECAVKSMLRVDGHRERDGSLPRLAAGDSKICGTLSHPALTRNFNGLVYGVMLQQPGGHRDCDRPCRLLPLENLQTGVGISTRRAGSGLYAQGRCGGLMKPRTVPF